MIAGNSASIPRSFHHYNITPAPGKESDQSYKKQQIRCKHINHFSRIQNYGLLRGNYKHKKTLCLFSYLFHQKVHANSLLHLLKRIKTLDTLIVKTSYNIPSIDSKSFNGVLSKLKAINIRKMKLIMPSECFNTFSLDFAKRFTQIRSLQSIYIDFAEEAISFFNSYLRDFMMNLKKITKLRNIHLPNIHFADQEITLDAIVSNLVKIPNLKELYFHFPINAATVTKFKNFMKQMPNMKSIGVYIAPGMEDYLEEIANSMTFLEQLELDISGLSFGINKTFFGCIANLKQLKYITLKSKALICERSLQVIFEALAVLHEIEGIVLSINCESSTSKYFKMLNFTLAQLQSLRQIKIDFPYDIMPSICDLEQFYSILMAKRNLIKVNIKLRKLHFPSVLCQRRNKQTIFKKLAPIMSKPGLEFLRIRFDYSDENQVFDIVHGLEDCQTQMYLMLKLSLFSLENLTSLMEELASNKDVRLCELNINVCGLKSFLDFEQINKSLLPHQKKRMKLCVNKFQQIQNENLIEKIFCTRNSGKLYLTKSSYVKNVSIY